MYTVPVIPPDLRHEETIIQAANALDYLQSTITNIFNRIDKRVSKNNAKINELSSRINSASIKIQNLSGINKAIKIFSPAKFPSSHVFTDIKLTFENGDARENIQQNNEIASRVDAGPNNIQDKLIFFYFHASNIKLAIARVSQTCGFGRINANIKSINSVLLFGTPEKVFCSRGLVDEMNVGQRNRNKDVLKPEGAINPGLLIEAAPVSLSYRQKSTDRRLQQSLFYTPKLNEAPIIDLPVDLPDLPGIVDDIQFNHTDNYQIAPSLFIENPTDLPEVVDTVEMKDESEVVVTAALETKIKTTKATSLPPLPLVVSAAAKSEKPPPPPPLPPPLPSQIDNTVISLKSKTSIAIETANDVRSTLMDAIRKAGGARGGRLRAAAEVARQQSTCNLNLKSNQPKNATSSDLMADLHTKLLMRRKGISGAKDGEAVADNGSVICRLSALIPPPSAKKHDSSSEEEEGCDDADWAD